MCVVGIKMTSVYQKPNQGPSCLKAGVLLRIKTLSVLFLQVSVKEDCETAECTLHVLPNGFVHKYTEFLKLKNETKKIFKFSYYLN